MLDEQTLEELIRMYVQQKGSYLSLSLGDYQTLSTDYHKQTGYQKTKTSYGTAHGSMKSYGKGYTGLFGKNYGGRGSYGTSAKSSYSGKGGK
ncbi:hypothetical protein H6504_04310 [Candidatus Woesearchaeota archaeon]|nr:hypothetical protein [Candidatus Woesearchaeota archaeon]